jgi:Flp pilus assembly protein TadB
MLLNILLSAASHIDSSLPKTPSPILMQYLMMLMMGGAALLNKKELRKVTRKLKWQLFKQSFKNMFKSNSGNSKKIRRIILLVLGGLLIWWLYTLIGFWSLLFLILLVVGFASSKNL